MLISKNALAIIKHLSDKQEGYISQIAKDIDISVGSAHQLLKEMESKGVVKSRAIGTAILYSLNREKRETQLILELISLREAEATT